MYKKIKKVDSLIREKFKFILIVGLIFSGTSFFYLSNIPKEFESKMLLRLSSIQENSFSVKEVDFLLRNKNFYPENIRNICSDSLSQKSNSPISFLDKIYSGSVNATSLYLVSFRSISFEINHTCLSAIFNHLSAQELLRSNKSETISFLSQESLKYQNKIDYLLEQRNTSSNRGHESTAGNSLFANLVFQDQIHKYEDQIYKYEEKVTSLNEKKYSIQNQRGLSLVSISDNPISVYPKKTVKILLSFLFGILIALAGFILKSFF